MRPVITFLAGALRSAPPPLSASRPPSPPVKKFWLSLVPLMLPALGLPSFAFAAAAADDGSLVPGAAARATTQARSESAPAGARPAPTAPAPDFLAAARSFTQAPRPHPYLLFTAAEKPALQRRLREDPAAAEIWRRLEREGQQLLTKPVDRAPPPRELHTRYLGRDDYRRAVGQHTEAAYTLAFLYQMTGDARYVAPALAHADVVCAQDSWVQSAHYYEIIYPRVWPYGARDDQVVFTYDITAAATSQRLACIYDWLYPALNKAQRDRLRGALLEKAIVRVRGNYEYYWWSTAYRCNWSGICHSGLGLAALALLHEDPQLVDVVARAGEGVWQLLENIGPDGGWSEGRHYWAFGLGESLVFIDALRRATGGQVDLFRHRHLRTHPVDFALFGLTAGFGDDGGTPAGTPHAIHKLAQESGDPHAAWYAQHFLPAGGGGIMELLWPPTTVRPRAPAEASKHFASVGWAVLRRDFQADALTLAVRAAPNDDPHHGHLDCGSFNLTWHNLTFVGEIPRAPYDEQYFNDTRWNYLAARSRGHNVVLVNGEEQVCAKLKDQPWRSAGMGGRITAYHSEPGWKAVALDATGAYAGRELKRWRRWLLLDTERNLALVVDRVGAAPGATIEVLFHPGVEFTVADNRAHLRPLARPDETRKRDASNAGVTRPERGGRGERSERNRTQLSPAEAAAGATTVGGAAAKPLPSLEMFVVADTACTLTAARQSTKMVTAEAREIWVPYYAATLRTVRPEHTVVSVFHPAGSSSRPEGAVQVRLEEDAGAPDAPIVVLTQGGRTFRYRCAPERVTRETR